MTFVAVVVAVVVEDVTFIAAVVAVVGGVAVVTVALGGVAAAVDAFADVAAAALAVVRPDRGRLRRRGGAEFLHGLCVQSWRRRWLFVLAGPPGPTLLLIRIVDFRRRRGRHSRPNTQGGKVVWFSCTDMKSGGGLPYIFSENLVIKMQ